MPSAFDRHMQRVLLSQHLYRTDIANGEVRRWTPEEIAARWPTREYEPDLLAKGRTMSWVGNGR